MIDVIWDRIRGHIGKAIDEAHGDLDEGRLRDRLRSGQEVALTVCDGPEIVTTCIVSVQTLDGGRRVLFIPSLGGERIDEWLDDGLAVLRQMAQQYGCDGIRACGRPGWIRKLPGAKAIHQIVEF